MKVSLLEGWPHFRGEFVLKSMLWDFSKCLEYRGGHILGVLIRGVRIVIYNSPLRGYVIGLYIIYNIGKFNTLFLVQLSCYLEITPLFFIILILQC